MVGAIIGAAITAASAIGNHIATSKANAKRKRALKRRERAAESDAVADRYGDWRYSGANLYFNKAADEMKDYVAQQRAARNVTGAVDNGTAAKAAGQAIGNAAGQAAAQRQAVGIQMYQQDKRRADGYADKVDEVNAAQSAATTQAWSQLGQSAGSLATAIGGSGASKAAANGSETASGAAQQKTAAVPQSQNTTIDFNRALTDLDYQREIKKQITGGL